MFVIIFIKTNNDIFVNTLHLFTIILYNNTALQLFIFS